MSTERTRRAWLALLAAGVGGAGCTSLVAPGTGTPDDASESPTGTGSGTDTPTTSTSAVSTDDPGRVVLEPADLPVDEPLTVFPGDLAEWLREAAGGETVREVAMVQSQSPEPLLPRFEHVRLRTPDGDLGTFAVEAEGGTYYDLLVGARAVESTPEDATVRPVSDLSEARRELALDAVEGRRRTVQPQTELGEWTREQWFGGHFRHDETVYRGVEVRQTDAAFFSQRLWYVLSLSSLEDERDREGADPVVLSLPDVDGSVRHRLADAVVDALLDGEGTLPTAGLSETTRSFLHETPYLLTHTAVLSVSVEPPA